MMKPPRAITVAGALLALAALAGCNKPTESSPPMQTPSLNQPASAPAAASAASTAGAASGASAAAGLDAAGGSGTGAGALAAVPAASAARPSDAQREAGAQIAARGTGNTAACASCHGQHGEGNASAGFPRIAGQSYAYLLHQLDASGSGARRNPVMSPIAKALTEAQRQQAAAYYASLNPAGAASGNPAPSGAAAAPARNAGRGKANERGRQLAIAGDESRFVQACVNCHGPGGSGEGSAYPYLGGQHQSYLLATLKAWRDGSRNTDPSGQMPVIAKSLAEDQLAAVAAYYAAQPLPGRPRDAVASALTAQRPGAAASAVTSGPRGNGGTSNGTRGSGTEQGAPTTGGAQGPGGGGGGSGSGSSGSPTGAAQTGTGTSAGTGASAPAH